MLRLCHFFFNFADKYKISVKGTINHFDMKNVLLIIVSAAVGICLLSCSASDTKSDTQGGEQTVISEQQKQQAAEKGWAAARELINAKDTFDLHAGLIKARAIQSEFVTQKRKLEAEAFDTAFIHTLRAVRPDIAREIEEQK